MSVRFPLIAYLMKQASYSTMTSRHAAAIISGDKIITTSTNSITSTGEIMALVHAVSSHQTTTQQCFEESCRAAPVLTPRQCEKGPKFKEADPAYWFSFSASC